MSCININDTTIKSMNTKYYILMGDVISSEKHHKNILINEFKSLVNKCNDEKSNIILSPFTITLGDEFQGIVKSLSTSIEVIFHFQELILKNKYSFKLRYVLKHGIIDTPINKETAYGMLGQGLSFARKKLGEKKRNRKKYQIFIDNQILNYQLENLLFVASGIENSWKIKDFTLIFDMLQNDNNSEIAEVHKPKNRSQIWKKRKNLFIKEYKILRQVIFDLIDVSEEF